MDTKQMLQEIYDKIGIGELIQSNDYNVVRDPNKKISLSRLLSALDNGNGFPNQSGYVYFQGEIYHQELYIGADYYDYQMDRNHICSRKLLNQDSTDAILDDQSPETIKAIYDILLPSK